MRGIGLAVAGLGAAAVLTACSGSDSGGDDGSAFAKEPAEDIAAAAKSAMADLNSLKVSGEVTSDGQQISIDLQTDVDGNCTGSMGIDDGTVELLGVDGSTWMKPDEAFWTSFAGEGAQQVMSIVGDKWVVIPSDGDSLSQFCNAGDLIDQLVKDDAEETTYTTTGTDTLDGQDVVLVDSDDPENGVSTGYVLVDEPHFLVKVERTEGDVGMVTFSEFDEPVEVEAPAADDQIDLDNLAG